MADQDTEISPVEQEARGLGWVPQDEFRGDTAKWVDAETFVKRGKDQLPILLENNRRLKADVHRLTGTVSQLTQLFEGSQEAIVELKRFHEETFDARIKSEKARIRAEIIAAREEGDVAKELTAQEQLDDLNDQVRTVTKTAKKEDDKGTPAKIVQPAPQAQETPEYIAWKAANPWLETDRRKAAVAFGLAQEVRAEHPEVTGEKFFKLLDKAIEEVFPPPRGSKVEPGKGGAGAGGGGGAGAKSYGLLPPDAKATCDAQAKKFVGAGKAFKTVPEWQAHYAKVYFDREA